MAVLTYLRRILESLDHPDMINLILHYLLALPDTIPSHRTGSRTSISDARKRKSIDLATMMAQKTETSATPLLFNLVDLILACLRSRNQQTLHVTLQLVSAILKRHHRYAIITLLKTEVLPTKTINRTIGAHEQEVEYLMSLAGSVGGYDNFDETYENVLKDTMSRLESHPCSLKLVAPKVSTNNHKLPEIPDSLPGAPRDVREHTLRPDDPLLNALIDLLETFFANAVETNLSATETLVDLAICGYMSIEGWLARGPNDYSYVEDENDVVSPTSEESEAAAAVPEDTEKAVADDSERIRAMEKCRRRPKWEQSSVPRMLDVLKRLCDQVATYKETIPRFEELVQQRRDAFETADAVLDNPLPARRGTPAQLETPDRPSLDELSRSGSPSRPTGIEGFAQRLLSELGTPSRSASPRGRKEQSRSSGTSTPGGNALGTPKAVLAPPREFPLNYHDPTRSGIARSRSPGGTSGDDDAAGDSQAAAFAAVDQSILSRRVGLPDEKLNPIPLRFDKKPMPEPVETAKVEEEGDGEKVEGALADDSETADTAEATTDSKTKDDSVSVSHVVTNVIIFQSFLLELASLIQVRAGLFDEVRFV